MQEIRLAPDHELIKKVVNTKDCFDTKTQDLVKDCMVELCNLCKTQKYLSRLNKLFDNLTDAVLIFDADLNFLDANKRGQFIYENFEKFRYLDNEYSFTEVPFIKYAFEKACNTAPVLTLKAISQYEGESILNFSVSIISFEESKPVGLCIVINDITALQRQTQQVEDSTGLGLYLSRKIIEAHDGEIWINSKLNEGTTVSFSLPLVSVIHYEEYATA